jgi:hypothetical protein
MKTNKFLFVLGTLLLAAAFALTLAACETEIPAKPAKFDVTGDKVYAFDDLVAKVEEIITYCEAVVTPANTGVLNLLTVCTPADEKEGTPAVPPKYSDGKLNGYNKAGYDKLPKDTKVGFNLQINGIIDQLDQVPVDLD